MVKIKNKKTQRLFFITMMMLVTTLSSCSMNYTADERRTKEIKAVPITANIQEGIWKSFDLELTFQQQRTDDRFFLTGELRFDSRILNTFPVIRSFSLELLLQDREGHILKELPVYIDFFHRGFAMEKYPIQAKGILTQEAEFFSFSYRGKFADYGERHPDTDYIEYTPPRTTGRLGT